MSQEAHELGRVADAINNLAENTGRVADAMDRIDVDPYSHLADAINNIGTAIEDMFTNRTVNAEVKIHD